MDMWKCRNWIVFLASLFFGLCGLPSPIWHPMESFVCWKATKHAFGVILLLCFCCFNFMLADKYCGIRHLLIWSATQWTQQSLLLLRFLRKQEPMTRKGCLVWLPLMLLGPRHSMLERPRCQLQVCPITHLRDTCASYFPPLFPYRRPNWKKSV